MQITVAELAKLLNGEIEGNPGTLISKVAKIEEGEPQALSFLANPKYEPYLYTTKSSAVIVNRGFTPTAPVPATLIKVDDAYASFTMLLEKFGNQVAAKSGVDSTAVVAATARVGNDVYIGTYACVGEHAEVGEGSRIFPHVVIGDGAKIGKNCIVYSGVNIYHDCVIGDNCIIHAGTVVGSDGFGFAPLADRSYKKIPQTGNVIIEDEVEIGANCTIDRATMGSTVIRKGVKLDNLVQVAHNVEIGEHTVVAAQSGIAGSTRIGRFCILAGQVGVSGHITIADGTVIGPQSGINVSITKPDRKWFGSPAFDYKDSLRSIVFYQQLPALEKRIRELEGIIETLKKENS